MARDLRTLPKRAFLHVYALSRRVREVGRLVRGNSVRCVRLSSCLAGELSPLVHRPPNSASPCTHPRRRSKAPDPKEQVKEWKKQMRGEERKLDRQIMSELRARLPPRRAAA